MSGRIWIVLGVLVGVAMGIGHFPYFSGAAASLSDTALRIVGTVGLTIVHGTAQAGAPRRVVEGLQAVVAVIVPGLTAWLLIVAAKGTLHLRTVVGVLVAALGVGAFFYLPAGSAIGVFVLALAAAGLAVMATGPLVAAPLAALAALIATVYLPRLITDHSILPAGPVNTLHRALFSTPGSPLWLQVVLLVVAIAPFALAARRVLD